MDSSCPQNFDYSSLCPLSSFGLNSSICCSLPADHISIKVNIAVINRLDALVSIFIERI